MITDQTLLDFSLETTPDTPLRSHRDYSGNLMHHVHLPNNHQVLSFEANSLVGTYDIPRPERVAANQLSELHHRFFEYLAPTTRVPLNEDWLGIFGVNPLTPDGEVVGYLEYLNKHLNHTR